MVIITDDASIERERQKTIREGSYRNTIAVLLKKDYGITIDDCLCVSDIAKSLEEGISAEDLVSDIGNKYGLTKLPW